MNKSVFFVSFLAVVVLAGCGTVYRNEKLSYKLLTPTQQVVARVRLPGGKYAASADLRLSNSGSLATHVLCILRFNGSGSAIHRPYMLSKTRQIITITAVGSATSSGSAVVTCAANQPNARVLADEVYLNATEVGSIEVQP